MRQGRVALALFLGGALTVGLVFLMVPHAVQSAPPSVSAPGLTNPHQVAEHVYDQVQIGTHYYDRVQTVTLHVPALPDMYATALTTTFETRIVGFRLVDWLRYPSDAITIAGTCVSSPTCGVIWTEVGGSPVISFTGTGTGTIHLAYNTWSRASRDPASPLITLSYPVGFDDPERRIGLTNTIVFSRSLDQQWQVNSVTPTGYVTDDVNHTLRWTFTDTSRLEFTVIFTEPLLGSDLVIEWFEMGNLRPAADELVRYTVTVRNVGPYRTRGVLTELLVRPLSYGAPIVLTDHVGGWLSYAMDAMFEWIKPPDPPISWTVWWDILEPGGAITGTAVLTWPEECELQACGVWAKADPPYLGISR
jgi:hypothetical protein